MEFQGIIEKQVEAVDKRFIVLQAFNCPNLNRAIGKCYAAIPPTCKWISKLSTINYFGHAMFAELPDSIKVGIINLLPEIKYIHFPGKLTFG